MSILTMAAEEFGPTLLREGAGTLVRRTVTKKVAEAAVSEGGQALIKRVAGERAAQFAESRTGQYVIKHEVKSALKGHSGEQKPVPVQSSMPAANQNLTPGAAYNRGITDLANAAIRSSPGGRAAGKSWWNTMPDANADWRQMGDHSVARGPGQWDLPGKRAVAFASGAVKGAAKGGVAAIKASGERADAREAAQGTANWLADVHGGLQRSAAAERSTWPTPSEPPSGMRASGDRISAINENLGSGQSSYSGTSSRSSAFEGGRLLGVPQPSGSFSTWPKPPTQEQEPGQVTPYSRSGKWTTSGGSFT